MMINRSKLDFANSFHSFTRIYIVELKIHISFTDEKTNYPFPQEIRNADEQLPYITSGLQSFLTMMIYEKEIVVAAIGQSIMQNARARAVLAPLQAVLGVQVHHVTGSKFMVQQLNKSGFAVSYSEVQLFERSAALNKGTDRPQEFDNTTYTLHLHTGHTDDTIATLDGYGQCHSMGIMASVSPGIRANRKRKIPRKSKFNHDDFGVVGTVLIRFTDWDGTNPGMKYRKTDLPAHDNKQTLFYQHILIRKFLCFLASCLIFIMFFLPQLIREQVMR